jgi:hypothetical protein
MKCQICKLEIQDGELVKQCRYCFSLFHEEHLRDWLKEKNTCPVCQKELISIHEKSKLKNKSLDHIPGIYSLRYQDEIKYYISLGITEIMNNELPVNFLSGERSFICFKNKRFDRFYILKKASYYEHGFKRSFYLRTFLPWLFAMIMFGLGLVPFLARRTDLTLVTLIISSINCLPGILTLIIYRIKARNLSKRWLMLEFQKDNIVAYKVRYPNFSFYWVEEPWIIPVQKVQSLKMGKSKKMFHKIIDKNEKTIVSLTIKMKNGKEYFLGDIYEYTDNIIQEEPDPIELFKKKHQLPIINIDVKIQKKRNWITIASYMLWSIVIVLNIAAVILIAFSFALFV